MDAGTHALGSVALTRILIPRAPLRAWIFIVAAGTIADLDALSSLFGPSSYFAWHYSYTHTIVAAVLFAVILSLLYFSVFRPDTPIRLSKLRLFSALALSGLLHLGLDTCQSSGVALFWPFNGHRFATDWLPGIDPWIIAILVAAILLPELARMVSEEIGTKSKGPHGRVGAIVGLVLVIVYAGVRANLHAGVLATVEARSYHGEVARRAGAYAESLSPFIWHAIVETDRALEELTVNAAPGAALDPEGSAALFKPEPSAVLDSAQNTVAGRKFLSVASFPKATMEKTGEGYEVLIRDLRYPVSGELRHEVVAVIQTDWQGKVTEDGLFWGRDYRGR